MSATPQLLLDFLLAKFPQAKRQTLKHMVEQKRVLINGRPAVRLKQALGAGDVVELRDREKPRPASIAPLTIVHEDEDVLVVEKPAGLLTSTTPREKRTTAIAIVREYLKAREPTARAGVIHRLDKDAAGLLVFSRNVAAFESLKQQFFNHTVERVYAAVVHGVPIPAKGRIEANLVELPDGSVRVTRRKHHGQRAITEYEVTRAGKGCALLRVRLETGRKHQIRSHLSQRGHPILGDSMYRRPECEVRKNLRATRLMLVAVELAFDHPRSGKRLHFSSRVPGEFLKLVES